MQCKRAVVLVAFAFLTTAAPHVWADAEYEALEKDVVLVHAGVWRDTIAVLEITEYLPIDELLPLFAHKDGRFTQMGTIAPGALVPMSTSGYHPPMDSRTINRSKLPVVALRDGYAHVVIDVLRGTTAWLKPTRRMQVTKLEDVRDSVQLLFPKGRASIDVFAKPGDKMPRRTIKASTSEFYDVVEARDGFVRLQTRHNEHFDDPLPPGFDRDVGWIRLRDATGITVWPINPDTC